MTVTTDGSEEFKTIQSAVDAVSVHQTQPTIIHIKPGTYREQVRIASNLTHVILEGEDAATTIITNNICANQLGPDGQKLGTFKTATVYIDGDDCSASNIAFENTAGNVGQALALSISGDRVQLKNCNLKGWQDTLYVAKGRQYFRNCYIDGHTDFIFGAATTVFDHCEIHCTQASYITAPSTPQDHPFGFVFLTCKLTGGDKTLLGRPWRDYGASAFIECEMGEFIRPQGWDNWRNPAKEKTARFSEYKSTGPGGDPSQRVKWSKQLTDEEAATYTIENIFAGSSPWNPSK
jgi:pectinesterase